MKIFIDWGFEEDLEILEPYLKYHKDKDYNYFIWLNSYYIGGYRFLRIPIDVKLYNGKKIHNGDDVCCENFSTEAFIEVDD